jgi:hypothetical protein
MITATRALMICALVGQSSQPLAGLIPYFKIGRTVRFRLGDVVEALERMRV